MGYLITTYALVALVFAGYAFRLERRLAALRRRAGAASSGGDNEQP